MFLRVHTSRILRTRRIQGRCVPSWSDDSRCYWIIFFMFYRFDETSTSSYSHFTSRRWQTNAFWWFEREIPTSWERESLGKTSSHLQILGLPRTWRYSLLTLEQRAVREMMSRRQSSRCEKTNHHRHRYWCRQSILRIRRRQSYTNPAVVTIAPRRKTWIRVGVEHRRTMMIHLRRNTNENFFFMFDSFIFTTYIYANDWIE